MYRGTQEGDLSSFTSDVIIRPYYAKTSLARKLLSRGVPYWRLIHGVKYSIGSEDSDNTVHIRAGFISDLASVPRLLTIFIPKAHPDYAACVLLHDWLLEYERHRFSRQEIDRIFYESLGVKSNPKRRSWLLYKSVSLWGKIVERGDYEKPSPHRGKYRTDDDRYSFHNLGLLSEALDDVDNALVAMAAARLDLKKRMAAIEDYQGLQIITVSTADMHKPTLEDIADNHGVTAEFVTDLLNKS